LAHLFPRPPGFRSDKGKKAVSSGSKWLKGKLSSSGGQDPNKFKGTSKLRVSSLIKNDSRLVNAAQQMGKNKKVQQEADELIQKFISGNTNPGLGTKKIFGNISYLRGRGGERVFYRMRNGTMEILAKSSKANEQTVINVLKKLYK
jgi:hypothetical protein